MVNAIPRPNDGAVSRARVTGAVGRLAPVYGKGRIGSSARDSILLFNINNLCDRSEILPFDTDWANLCRRSERDFDSLSLGAGPLPLPATNGIVS
jgi:hypothetical protein